MGLYTFSNPVSALFSLPDPVLIAHSDLICILTEGFISRKIPRT